MNINSIDLESKLYILACKIEGMGSLLSSIDTDQFTKPEDKDAFYGIGLILEDVALEMKNLSHLENDKNKLMAKTTLSSQVLM